MRLRGGKSGKSADRATTEWRSSSSAAMFHDGEERAMSRFTATWDIPTIGRS